jgi:hypothetical protein
MASFLFGLTCRPDPFPYTESDMNTENTNAHLAAGDGPAVQARTPKERPILFSAPMVRALLAGTKTQTRRLVKYERAIGSGGRAGWYVPKYPQKFLTNEQFVSHCCPYGQPGDRLWVRENGWERPERTPKMMREGADTWEPYYYDADGLSEQEAEDFKAWGFKRRPSIHMPRWASRILLEVTEIRVQRLQQISEADAQAEGCSCYVCDRPMDGLSEADCHCFHRKANATDYRDLWESINGEGSWDANPYVWAVSFTRIKP